MSTVAPPAPAPAPAVLVHGLADALAALAAAAECGLPVTLLSAPSAAAHGGVLWFLGVAELARRRHPGAACTAVLDCDDRAGDAQGALAAGAAAILFTGPAAVATRLEAIAVQRGAIVLTRRPAALDLTGVRNRTSACRAWLLAKVKGALLPHPGAGL